MRIPDLASEAQLEKLRQEAKEELRGRSKKPMPVSLDYSGRPYLKPPVWTWEVPCYFFLGGLSGACALLGFFACLQGQRELALQAFCSAFLGASLSPILLASDLGRPLRALNMFRVFKWRSAMSVGSWGLLFFGASSGSTLLLAWLWDFPEAGPFFWLLLASSALSGLFGIFLMTYTGVLLGLTVVPFWVAHRGQLPFLMGLTALGSGAAWLEVISGGSVATTRLLVGVALLETLLWLWHRLQKEPPPGLWPKRFLAIGDVLTGPATLLLLWVNLPPILACGAFLFGGLFMRFGWIQAGKASVLATFPE